MHECTLNLIFDIDTLLSKENDTEKRSILQNIRNYIIALESDNKFFILQKNIVLQKYEGTLLYVDGLSSCEVQGVYFYYQDGFCKVVIDNTIYILNASATKIENFCNNRTYLKNENDCEVNITILFKCRQKSERELKLESTIESFNNLIPKMESDMFVIDMEKKKDKLIELLEVEKTK